jgi:hypothetical protein
MGFDLDRHGLSASSIGSEMEKESSARKRAMEAGLATVHAALCGA